MMLTGSQPPTFTFALSPAGRRESRRSGSVASIMLALCVLVCAATAATAQNIEFTQGNVNQGFENTLQVPLRSYTGRGGTSLPVTLNYSSKVWRLSHFSTVGNGGYPVAIAEAYYAEYSTAGWTTSLDIPRVEWPKQTDGFFYSGGPYNFFSNPSTGAFRVRRVYIHMPDGSAHELRENDQPYQGSIDMVGTFYAVDGSRLRYDSTGQNTGTLYLTDGTRYVLGGSTAQFIDRKGNKLSYNLTTRQWTDSLGRVIGMPLPANPQTSQYYPYTLPGLDGPITYQFRFQRLSEAGVLTPDANNQTPARKPIANDYLPSPNQPPTNNGGGNYPLVVQPAYAEPPSLFITAGPDEGDPATVLGRTQSGGQVGGELFNPMVLTEIVLPNGLRYTFSYNIYGEIDKIVYPTGGYERYEYDVMSGSQTDSQPYNQAERAVKKREVSVSGSGNDLAVWQYSIATVNQDASIPFNTTRLTTIAPDMSRTEVYKHDLVAPAHGTSQRHYWSFGFQDARQGMAYETRFHAPNPDGSKGPMLRRSLTEWESTTNAVPPRTAGLPGDVTETAYRNARSAKEVNLILDTGGNALAKTMTYTYGNTTSSGVVTTQHQLTTGLDLVGSTESQFIENISSSTAQSGSITDISPGTGPLANTTVTSYLDDENYRSRNILGLVTSVVMKDASGQPVSKTVKGYDEFALQTYTDLGTDPQWDDPQTTARGNVTTVRRYIDASAADVALSSECPAGVCLDSRAYFDQAGNIWKTRDARGNESVIEFSSLYKHAYPTAMTSADPDGGGAATALTTSTVYDLVTGLILTTTDANGQVTELKYEDDSGVVDPMNRLVKVIQPNGGWTSYFYGETPGQPLYVRTTTSLDATRTIQSYQFVDGFGRPSRSFASEGGSQTTYLTTDTQYDLMGRTSRMSVPYRTTALTDSVNPADKWTTTAYDVMGRVKTVTLPDNSTVQTTYQGVYTTVTDQALKKRRQKVDALDRIVRVDEPDASGSLGTNDTPAQPTSYDYDTLGNLIHLAQGTGQSAQHRYFKYDALSRLTYEKQVEQAAAFTTPDSVMGNNSWTRKLIYDETISAVSYKGLLTSHYDARSVLTRYTYDNLNRAKQVTYTDGTPAVTNYYDQAQTGYFNKGRLTEVKTAAAAASGIAAAIPLTSQAYDYDLMGRIKLHKQTVGTNVYTTSYVYGLGGQLESETYPSGRVVRHSYDGAGRLAGVDNGASVSYANTFVYGPKGALTSMTLGSGAVQTFDYNDRLQLATTSLVKDSTILQRYDYKYGQINVSTGALDETKNNGQIARIESYLGPQSTPQKQWQQRYGYDSLGRLSAAAEYQGATTTRSYLINYNYDQFGNRYQYAASNPSSTNPLERVPVEDGQIDKLTNRFVAATNVTYDAAGNTLTDGKFTQQQYTYDANNRQRTVSTDGTAANAYTSVYDGAGQRVATVFGGQTAIMVYDALGKLVAEYGQPGTSGGTQYVFTDHQGSTRLVTNSSGTLVSRHDYQPFGGEISSTIGLRATTPGYGQADIVRQKHAGMEQDDGSSLSHTLWRKQDYLSGRWTSPDPYGGSMTVADPQSFNRYTYVNNDPVNQTDPLGLMAGADVGYSGFGGWGGVAGLDDPHFGGPGIVNDRFINGFPDEEEEKSEEQPQQEPSTAPTAEQMKEAMGGQEPPVMDQSVSEDQATRDLYNCIAWGFGISDRWVEPALDGGGGYFVISNRGTTNESVVRKPFEPRANPFTGEVIAPPPMTVFDLPKAFGGKKTTATETLPADKYRMVVFSDSTSRSTTIGSTHVMRQEADGTWSSKNGPGPRYTRIKDPVEFYNRHYNRGQFSRVETRYYKMPVR